MGKHIRTASPYDLNATLKDGKRTQAEKAQTREQSPYTLSHDTSLRTANAQSSAKK